jgi:hypothetical protein
MIARNPGSGFHFLGLIFLGIGLLGLSQVELFEVGLAQTLSPPVEPAPVGLAPVAEKKFPSVQLSGVFQADGVAFEQDEASRQAYGQIESGADFRRARLGAKGSLSDRMDYFMQMDFIFIVGSDAEVIQRD